MTLFRAPGFILFTSSALFFVDTNAMPESPYCSEDIKIQNKYTVGDFQITLSRANAMTCGRIDIIKNGKNIYHDEEIGGYYYPGGRFREHDQRILLHLPRPHLVISKWSGGMHCCYSLLIFELGDEFKQSIEIEGGNFQPELTDLNKDGIPEVRITDDFLAYSFSCFADSATGRVILKYAGDKFVLAEELMKHTRAKKPFLPSNIRKWRELLKMSTFESLPYPVMQAFTELIFTRNTQAALEFLDQVWPNDALDKNEFLKSYKEALSHSIYYSKASQEFP